MASLMSRSSRSSRTSQTSVPSRASKPSCTCRTHPDYMNKLGFVIGHVHEKDNPDQWLVDFGPATIASILTKKMFVPNMSGPSTLEMFVYGKETFDVVLNLAIFLPPDQMHKLTYFGFYTMPSYTSDILMLVINSKLYSFTITNEKLKSKNRFDETFQKSIVYKKKCVGYLYKRYPRLGS